MPKLNTGSQSLIKFDSQFPVYNWMHPVRGEELGAVTFDEVAPKLDPTGVRERALYFHIPFCDTICTFCTLNRGLGSEGDEALEQYTKALVREIQLKSEDPWVAGAPARTIFFGGGTPSVLSADQLERICQAIRQYLDLSDLKEWIFEMEVKSVTEEKCAVLAEYGVNRSRYGIQTFDPQYRELFNITATPDQVHKAIDIAGRHFESRSIDMIYGMHGQSFASLSRDIQGAIDAGTEAIDFYPITNIAAQGSLHSGYAKRGLQPTPYIDKMAMTSYLDRYLQGSGFRRHNGHGYLRGDDPAAPAPYDRSYRNYYNSVAIFGNHDCDVVGFGSSAISQNGRHVLQNDPNRTSYIRSIMDDGELTVRHTVSDREPYDRGLVMYLPYMGYVDKSRIPWEKVPAGTLERLETLKAEGMVTETGDQWLTTELGWLWYVNLMYFLSSPEDQQTLDDMVGARSRNKALSDGDRRMIDLVLK
jgi:coproporphyrinogen III oxidase-like Fe-S oxidoreductase